LRADVRAATLAVGLGIFGAYGPTLEALAMVDVARVPAVAALRETSILFVAALSWRVGPAPPHGRERGRRRAGLRRCRRPCAHLITRQRIPPGPAF
jgi:hypothetical protein